MADEETLVPTPEEGETTPESTEDGTTNTPAGNEDTTTPDPGEGSSSPETPSTDDTNTPESTPDEGEGSGDSSNNDNPPAGGDDAPSGDAPTDENGNSGNEDGDNSDSENGNGSEESNTGVEENPTVDPVEEDDGYNGTQFSAIYNRFLEKVTDDMYMELTPEDTIRDLQNLLTDAIPGFEFPRVCLDDYKVKTKVINEADAKPGDFILAVLWQELPEDGEQLVPDVLVERSCFKATLSSEEINILALLMKQGWVQRQVSSIEVTRMKYTGSDFKMTSQANHLSKLLSLLTEAQRESFHMQRLYKRRKKDSEGVYRSDWSTLMQKHVF